MKTHPEIIELWPSVNEFAEDVGTSPNLVRCWKHRKSIPAPYWTPLVTAAQDRDIPLTYRMLAEAVSIA